MFGNVATTLLAENSVVQVVYEALISPLELGWTDGLGMSHFSHFPHTTLVFMCLKRGEHGKVLQPSSMFCAFARMCSLVCG
jgi:hypothetical protein